MKLVEATFTVCRVLSLNPMRWTYFSENVHWQVYSLNLANQAEGSLNTFLCSDNNQDSTEGRVSPRVKQNLGRSDCRWLEKPIGLPIPRNAH